MLEEYVPSSFQSRKCIYFQRFDKHGESPTCCQYSRTSRLSFTSIAPSIIYAIHIEFQVHLDAWASRRKNKQILFKTTSNTRPDSYKERYIIIIIIMGTPQKNCNFISNNWISFNIKISFKTTINSRKKTVGFDWNWTRVLTTASLQCWPLSHPLHNSYRNVKYLFWSVHPMDVAHPWT